MTDDNTVRQALEKMSFHRYTAMPVLNSEGVYLGTLRNDDVFDYFRRMGSINYRQAEHDSVMSILDVNYTRPLGQGATMTELVEEVKEHNYVPIVDDRGCFIGIILRRDVLNFLFEHYRKDTESMGVN
jgi:CBS-domain-containing membrane protein